MPMPSPASVIPRSSWRPSGWVVSFLTATLVWNAMAVLGALAHYGDTQHAGVPVSLPLTLLRLALQYLPLTALSLILTLGLRHLEPQRPRVSHWLCAYGGTLLIFVPALGYWQGAIGGIFSGKPVPPALLLLARQTALSWWFDIVLITIAFGAHLAYSAMRRAHGQSVASQQTQQSNLALRLRLLQGQLEPYFLSSSLSGIRKLIRGEQREHAARALARLSDLLRYAIRASQSDWQSVADEIQFMRDYIDMQGICHGTHISVEWQLEQCDWADYRCPPLLLFPILDQATLACMAGGAASPCMTISIVRTHAVGAAQVQVQARHPRGVGAAVPLTELRERLAMLYDGAATLSVTHDADLSCIELVYPVSCHDD